MAKRENRTITIINKTSIRIDGVRERIVGPAEREIVLHSGFSGRLTPIERALIIEEAVHAVALSMSNPNSAISKAMRRNLGPRNG